MVAVPAGEFWMGCNEAVDDQCDLDEYPYHQVELPTFWIDRYEVTLERFEACFFADACTMPGYCHWGHSIYGEIPEIPINCVSWQQAVDLCAFEGKRLPTEAEWEKAARGPDGRLYPWGDEPPTCEHAISSFCDGPAQVEIGGTAPAGVSYYGAFDMAGNLREWVNDRYGADYYGVSPSFDPPGPAAGGTRVVRGGNNFAGAQELRASNREFLGPDDWNGRQVGFRCAKSP